MVTKVQTNFKDTPFDFNELLRYNQDGFNKTKLELELTAKDDKGDSSTIEHVVNVYDIDNISRDENIFEWYLTNYSNVELSMTLEIIDVNRNIVKRCKTIDANRTNIPTAFREINIDLNDYPNGDYFYRINLTCFSENWNEYYPSRSGVLFEINHYELKQKEKTIDGTFRYEGKWLMDNLTNLDNTVIDPEYLKSLINKMCSPVNTKVFDIESKSNKDKHRVEGQYNSYAEENNYGMNENKVQFTMDEVGELISDKYKVNTYVDGKKIFHTDTKIEQKLDGISFSYIQESEIANAKKLELESFRSHVIDTEGFKASYLLQTKEDTINLYNSGIDIYTSDIGSYHTSKDFSVFVKFKNSNLWRRVNPFRTKVNINFIGKGKYSLNIIVKDNYVPVIGNEIMVITNNIMNSMFYKTDAFNKLASYYQVPCYFVPVTHLTDNGEIMTEFMTELDNIEVYSNGYRLVPNVDFSIVNTKLHGFMPTMILFKDINNFGSKIEVIYHDYMENTYYFYNEVPSRTDNRAVITLDNDNTPFIEGTFTIFANNKKLSSNQYDIINSKSLVLKGTKTKKNIMIKFHYDDDELLKRYINLYKKNPSKSDLEARKIGQDKYVDKFIKDNNSPMTFEEDNDYYIGLKYVYQLDESYNYFEQIYGMIQNQVEPLLDANNQNLFKDLKKSPVIMDYLKKLPTYFNHHISVNCNREFNNRRWEDNVALFNPGRAYLIFKEADNKFNELLDCDFNCNSQGSIEFLSFLNENIPLILPYLNNNILIDCNEPQSRDNYKGLK